eukprot:TRINITY_DN4937_c0_g1_i1.p1 TRINITY_DN4937_c0_g1~~TRINITY_DN4937_c0_g1_i1.p1  ORF type:complete len:359 (+),score=146.73 TRINITY_DN4937_c0_g1_i1:235-1311(+)
MTTTTRAVYAQEPYPEPGAPSLLSSAESSFSMHSSGSDAESRTASGMSASSTNNQRRKAEKTDPRVIVTPWFPQGMLKTRLNIQDEVRALHKMLQLTPDENSKRHMARSAIQEIVQNVWPDATVKVYGSFAYGMSLPSSCLDLVCEDCRELQQGALQDVFRKMEEAGITVQEWTATEDSAFATVKLASMGCQANISFVLGKSTARKSVAEVRRLIDQFPAVGPVFAVVRLVLQQSRCGDVRTGGLPSYAALVMILHSCYRCKDPSDASLLLMDFFNLYASTGVPSAGEPLFIEDPLCSENNLAAGCVRMPQIRSMFKNCAMTLEKWTTNKWEGYRGRSPLSSIIAYDNLWRDLPECSN